MLTSLLPKDYSLPDDEVHIWQTRLDLSYDRIEGLREILGINEQQRADRFNFESDRKRHIIARGLLRLVVARLLNTSPELLRITSTSHGKPHLLRDVCQPRIEFNISHSGELIYVVIANSWAVGIDVEKVRNNFTVEMIARGAFSTIEFDELMALDPALRLDSLFTCWTRKEAWFKAKGEGLTALSHRCGKSLFGQLPMPICLANPEVNPVANWTLLDLQVDTGYRAAVAFEGTDCRVRRWKWPAMRQYSVSLSADRYER
jgi:4'-phosphopantetheinyl transferase